MSGTSTYKSYLKRYFIAWKILLPGLVIAQGIATIQVYLSNLDLYYSLEIINSAGYLIIPNLQVMKSLLKFGPAFYGGLFFTLSTGAFLSLLGLASAFIWLRIFLRKKIFLILFLILWAIFIAKINSKGFYLIITSYFVFVPSVVFLLAIKLLPVQQDKQWRWVRIAPVFPFLLLALLYIFQIDSTLFLNIRDHLLLSNSFGEKINDFYYKYTLYPANVIKPLYQRTLKTFCLDKIDKNKLADQLRKKLINHDFLEINKDSAVDLTISEQDNLLVFREKDVVILKTSIKDFFSRPEKILKKYSSQIDKHIFFRRFTLFSLLTGFPSILFIFSYTIIACMLYVFLGYRNASLISLYLCLFAGIFISILLHCHAEKKISQENLSEALKSGQWQDKVAALRIIEQKGLDITGLGKYKDMLSSPRIPVRYWLAKALGASKDHDGYDDLLKLLDDPCPNVVCMAFYSLGKKGGKNSIQEILNRIQTSDHWYEQWYAYRALRALGWKQKKLDKKLFS